MGQLTNQYVSSSYQGLLKMTDSTQGLTNTLQTIQTGDGDNSPLQMSFTEVNISGSFFINNVPITNGTNGTSGTSGVAGSSGTSGSSGSNGSSGTSGSNGSSGTSGSNGSDGSSGTSGGTGSSGTSGSNGSSGTSGDSLFALTGSVWSTTNNLQITGSLFVSSSVASDVVINGQLYVSSSSTNAANAPKIIVSGSGGNTTINRNSVTVTTPTNVASLNPQVTFISDVATLDEIGYTIDPNSYGISGWTKGAAIYTNDPTDSYPAMIGFQNKANYTDGTVTILNGLDVSGSVDITGQYLVNGVPVSGGDRNGLITTGSITSTQEITGSLILGNTVISGSLIGNTVNGGLIKIQNEANRSGSIQFNITGSNPISQSNVIFGNPTGPAAVTQTGSVVISGSNNIITQGYRTDTIASGQGTYGYIGGNGNIGNTIPTLGTGSLLRPTINQNALQGGLSLQFTTSSLGQPSFQSNLIYNAVTINHQSGSISYSTNGTLGGSVQSTQNITTPNSIPIVSANLFTGNLTTTLNHNSSSIIYQGNIGPVIVTNNYSSSVSTTVDNIAVNQNLFNGTGETIIVTGSNTGGTRRTFNSNLISGRSNLVNSNYVPGTGSFTTGHLVATAILGQQLIVSASHTNATIGGSVFVGRFNATGSLQESSQETIFVVGTGGGDNSRRNALRIDNSNNSNFTGSVNISGSLTLNGVAVGSSDRNGLITTGSIGQTQQITSSLSIVGNASNLNILGNAGKLVIDSGSINLNNDGQSQITNQRAGTNVMYVDNIYKNFFFGNVPKAQSGRFSGDTGNFIVSPTYAAFETGSNNILIGTSNIGLLSGSNNIRIGGEPNFGSSDYNDTLYIGGSGGVNTNIIQKFGTGGPIQLGYNTQITGSLNVSNGAAINNGATITGSLTVSGSGVTLIGTNTGEPGNTLVIQSGSMKMGDISGSLRIATLNNQPQLFFNQSRRVGFFLGQSNMDQVNTQFGITDDSTDNYTMGGNFNNFRSGSNNLMLAINNISLRSGSYNVIVARDTNYNTGSNNLILGRGPFNVNEVNDYFNLQLPNSIDPIMFKSGSANALTLNSNVLITGSLNVLGGINYSSGSNTTVGTAVLDGGNPSTVTVSNSLVTANSLIFITKQTLTNAHSAAVSSKGGGTFTITSTGNGDSDVVAYQIINPA